MPYQFFHGAAPYFYAPVVIGAIGWETGPGQTPGDTGTPTAPAGGDSQLTYPATIGAPAPAPPVFQAGTPLVVSYLESGASTTSTTEAHPAAPMQIYLGDGAAGPTVPGSLRFTFRGRTYVDRAGTLVYDVDPATNTGTNGGTFDYSANIATLTDYVGVGSDTVTITSMLTRYVEPGVSGIMFRTPGSPVQIGSFTLRATTMTGALLTASVNNDGDITGTKIRGGIDWTNGLVRVAFGELVTAAGHETEPWYDAALIDGDGKIWKPEQVDPGSVFFGTVINHAIPVDPDLIGIDPVRLPSDGRVPAFASGEIAVVSYTKTVTLTPTAADVTDLTLERLDSIEILDATGVPIVDTWYTVDLDDGTVTWADPLNLSAYTMPVSIRARIVDAALIADVQITGEITLATPLTHAFPIGSIVSCAVPFTDMQSRVANLFDQATYQAGVWSDELVGAPASGTYNSVLYPIDVSNDAAIDERWALVFTNPTTVNVIGETVGQIVTAASITADIAPINPVTVTVDNPGGKPYFTIDKDGWGGGWASGNVVRFNTVSATRPIWLARVVTPGELTEPNDRVRANLYGNAN